MKKTMALLLAGGFLISGAATASAAGFPFLSSGTTDRDKPAEGPSVSGPVALERAVPAPPAEGTEGGQAEPKPVPMADGAELDGAAGLYPWVEYEDLDNVHPCGVPKIVAVRDPRICQDPCDCCKPACVFVKICVPPDCCPPKVSEAWHGRQIKYDYGDYRVEIKYKKNCILKVDYDRSLKSRLSELTEKGGHGHHH